MHRTTLGRLQVAIDAAERALLDGTPTRQACDALRRDVARIVALDVDEGARGARQEPGPSTSQVRGVWEATDEAVTPVVNPRARRR